MNVRHSTRRIVLALLSERGPMRAAQLRRLAHMDHRLEIALRAICLVLNNLERQGVVERVQRSKDVIWRLKEQP